MGKQKLYLSVQLLAALSLVVGHQACAEDMFINCADPNANSEQCAALYAQQAAMPTGVNYQVNPQGAYEPTAFPGNINPANPDMPIQATVGQDFVVPGMGYELPQQQVVIRDTAAPISIAQPMDEEDELGSEYAVYKTPTGSFIMERDVTQEQLEDGVIVKTSRTKETTVTPPYVEMPSISAHQRGGKLAYGEEAHDWEANNGDSLRSLLIEWGQKSGWTVVWKLDRDYILEAGVVFRGNFTEVASAIIRTFARAVPAPIGTFYKGNRVLVINTQEDDNA